MKFISALFIGAICATLGYVGWLALYTCFTVPFPAWYSGFLFLLGLTTGCSAIVLAIGSLVFWDFIGDR